MPSPATFSRTNQQRTQSQIVRHEVRTEAPVRLEGSSHHPHKTQNKAPKRRWSSESVENEKVVISTKVPKVHKRISAFKAEGMFILITCCPKTCQFCTSCFHAVSVLLFISFTALITSCDTPLYSSLVHTTRLLIMYITLCQYCLIQTQGIAIPFNLSHVTPETLRVI